MLFVAVNTVDTSMSAKLFWPTLDDMKPKCTGGGAPPANVLQLVSPLLPLQVS